MSQARMRRLLGMGPRKRKHARFDEPYDFNDDEFGKLNEPFAPRRRCPLASGSSRRWSSAPGRTPHRVGAIDLAQRQ
jgi:S-DNA-T family DNA segregation ATPase FtsK/SpoIIIE